MKTFKTNNGYTEFKGYPNVKFRWGYPSREKTNSCYFICHSHYKSDEEDKRKKLRLHIKKIKGLVERKLKEKFFYERHICISELPDSLERAKNSFVEIEFHLFPYSGHTKEETQDELVKYANEIYETIYKDKSEFYIRP